MMNLLAAFLFCSLCIGTGLTDTERAVDGLGDGSPFAVEGAQHLPYGVLDSYQVILPGLKFNCYGEVTSWSALVVYRYIPGSGALYQVTFQVWRPNGSGRYRLVGFDKLFRSSISPIRATHENEELAYYYLSNATEQREGNQTSENTKPLYFKPGDIIGFDILSLFKTATHPMFITYRNQAPGDPDHLVMDLFYNTTDGGDAQCEMDTCSDGMEKIESVVPNIFFTYEEVSKDSEVFLHQDPSSTVDCEPVEFPVEECPPSVAPSSSLAPSNGASVPSTSPSLPPQGTQNVILIIAVSAGGSVLILVLGGILIVVVALVCKKKKTLGDDYDSPREASNALYSEMNVDEPTAYASTYRIKPGIYVEQERNAANPSTPHFSIRAGDSVMSLSSHNGRAPFSISGPVHSNGQVPFQRILQPSEMGAMSMQLPRGYRNGGSSAGEDQRRSLRVVSSGTHQRPPIPSAMHRQNTDGNSRHASMPLKSIRDTQNQLNPGKSLPALSSYPQSPSPYPCPPTPQISDPPVPYLLPIKPWYKSNYEPTKVPEKERPHTLPGEEGLYVPTTMEEGNGTGEDYSRLRQPHHSKGSNDDSALFEGPDVFNEPASSTNEIYQQLSSWKAREIIRKYIT
jgi:hypothetical protein